MFEQYVFYLRDSSPALAALALVQPEILGVGMRVVVRAAVAVVVFEGGLLLDVSELRHTSRAVVGRQGLHFCLGAPLARMEAQIAINTLLRRMPNLRLKVSPDSLRGRPSMILRGLDALPVLF